MILLTQTFPFGLGEPFIAYELADLAARLGPLSILPVARTAAVGCIRALPAGVSLHRPLLAALATARRRPWPAVLGDLLTDPRARASLVRGLWDLPHDCAAGPQTRAWPAPRRLMHLLRAVAHAQMVAACLERLVPDSALYYSYWLGPTALAAAWASRAGQARAVARAHGADVEAHRCPPYYLPLRRQAMRAVDAVLCVSAAGQAHLEAYAGAPGRLALCRLGVPTAMATRASDDGILRLLSCARLVPLKRLSLLAAALARLPSSLQVHWTHLGDGPMATALARQVARLPAHVQVHLAGAQTPAAVAAYYAEHAVDFFVSVSAAEGLPVSIMEALSRSVPVLATDVGGVAELVGPRCGALVSADLGAAELAAAIARVAAADSCQRANWRRGARATWLARVALAPQMQALVAHLAPTPARAYRL